MSVFKCSRIVGLVGLIMLLVSCDVAGGLFSQSELAGMYEVWIDNNGLTLGDGDLVRSDSSLIPVIESPGTVNDPGKLTLVLVDMDGSEAARLSFMTEADSELDTEDDSLRRVRSLKGPLPSFSFPEDLAEGYYSLESRLYDPAGRTLSTTATLVLVYNGVVPAPRIETFPSSPTKGQAVFLRLASDLPREVDPWVRWYVGGGMRKEGFASTFADRLVWQIPETDGFFSVRAELFPFKPPAEVLSRSVSSLNPRLPAFRADLILAVGPAQASSTAVGIDRAFSVDFKSDPESQQLEAHDGTYLPLLKVGSPYVESHEFGYGHAILSGSGYLIPASILPQAGLPFTLHVAFDPLERVGASGTILTLHDGDGTSSFLRLGLSGGLPYLEAGDQIVQAFVAVPAGLSQLVLEVVPSDTDMAEAIVSLFVNNELVGNGGIPGSLLAKAGQFTTLVGGPEGLAAVYDTLAVMHGRYQAFLVAKTQEFGNSLIAASGFEGGSLGRGIHVQGSAKAEDGFMELAPDTALEIPIPASGFTVDIAGYGTVPELMLVMEDGSMLNLSVDKPVAGLLAEADTGDSMEAVSGEGTEAVAGEVLEPALDEAVDPVFGQESGPASAGFHDLTVWQAAMDQYISISVEAVSGGLRISDGTRRTDRIPTELSVIAFRVQPALSASFTVETIMARTFDPVASNDQTFGDQTSGDQTAGDQTAGFPLVIPSETAN